MTRPLVECTRLHAKLSLEACVDRQSPLLMGEAGGVKCLKANL